MKQNITHALQKAREIITEEQPISAGYMTEDWLALFMATAYTFNDLAVEITQRIYNITVIATQKKVSLIYDKQSTRYGYESGQPLCLYEDLEADLQNILMYIDTCFQRIDID